MIYAQLRLAIPNSFVYIVITKDEGPEKRSPGGRSKATAGKREHRPEADSLFEMTGNDPGRRRARSPEKDGGICRKRGNQDVRY